MTSSRNLRLLDLDQLADECANQTRQFFDRTPHDTRYCFELFRRAIVDRNNHAWEKVYQQYKVLVVGWVISHNSLSATGEEIDYFVNGAFDRIWSAVDAEKFKTFEDVAGLLHYLKMCVHSIIVDHARAARIETVDLEDAFNLPSRDLSVVETLMTDQLERCRLWQVVVDLTNSEQELIVARLSFIEGLKSAEICAACPEHFESVSDIYQVKRNLVNRLRRSPIMREFLDP